MKTKEELRRELLEQTLAFVQQGGMITREKSIAIPKPKIHIPQSQKFVKASEPSRKLSNMFSGMNLNAKPYSGKK